MAWFTADTAAPLCEKISGTGHTCLCRNEWEILFADRAGVLLEVNGKTVCLDENELYIISPGIVTALKLPENGSCFSLRFSRELVRVCRASLPLFLNGDKKNGVFSADFTQKNHVKELFSEIFFCSVSAERELLVNSAALRLLAAVCKNAKQSAPGSGFSDVLLYINENFIGLSAEEAARKFSYSTCYFSRSFRSAVGTGFKEYVLFLKVCAAKTMLAEQKMSVAEIAERLGFSSPSHFIHVFKKAANLSPLRYRNERKITKTT